MHVTGNGIALRVNTPWGRAEFASPMVGAFNAQNLLGVLGVMLASDVPIGAATAALARLQPPTGRMQRLGGNDRPLVIVDYAHTPDALEKVLTALRPAVAAQGELICVFGCGGDRDAGKRPEMGHIAARFADRIVVTSDNPRSEDPSLIANAVARGVRDEGNRRWMIEIDRREAIRGAVAAAKAGDVVLVAGKGHETYQEREGTRMPFSDVAVATAALSEWSAA
jgi:UDP-N-acetylmuramoyl-L-alanyl-D-glutamate--2,6-diaminopimelate ligase